MSKKEGKKKINGITWKVQWGENGKQQERKQTKTKRENFPKQHNHPALEDLYSALKTNGKTKPHYNEISEHTTFIKREGGVSKSCKN